MSNNTDHVMRVVHQFETIVRAKTLSEASNAAELWLVSVLFEDDPKIHIDQKVLDKIERPAHFINVFVEIVEENKS